MKIRNLQRISLVKSFLRVEISRRLRWTPLNFPPQQSVWWPVVALSLNLNILDEVFCSVVVCSLPPQPSMLARQLTDPGVIGGDYTCTICGDGLVITELQTELNANRLTISDLQAKLAKALVIQAVSPLVND